DTQLVAGVIGRQGQTQTKHAGLLCTFVPAHDDGPVISFPLRKNTGMAGSLRACRLPARRVQPDSVMPIEHCPLPSLPAPPAAPACGRRVPARARYGDPPCLSAAMPA